MTSAKYKTLGAEITCSFTMLILINGTAHERTDMPIK
jgi:hypothetical protein